MERVFSKVEELAGNVQEYVNARIDSVKLNVAEKGSLVIANAVAVMVVAILLLLFIGLASIALSIVLGEWIGKAWAGFLLVACFYLLIAVVVWVGRDRLIRLPVMNLLIRQLFNNNEENK